MTPAARHRHQRAGMEYEVGETVTVLDGPFADFETTDAHIFAMNGMLRGIGKIEGPPYIPPGYQAQIIGGATAYIGALGHILGRELGNLEPSHLETSIFEAIDFVLFQRK